MMRPPRAEPLLPQTVISLKEKAKVEREKAESEERDWPWSCGTINFVRKGASAKPSPNVLSPSPLLAIIQVTQLSSTRPLALCSVTTLAMVV